MKEIITQIRLRVDAILFQHVLLCIKGKVHLKISNTSFSSFPVVLLIHLDYIGASVMELEAG